MKNVGNLWGGRFTASANALFARFNQSFGFDRRLFSADIEASRAHANALHRAEVLNGGELNEILNGLDALRRQFEAEGNDFFDEMSEAEDVHSFIEAKLVARIGETGKRLHTGRSRNDQVATAMRLWTRDAIDALQSALKDAQRSLLDFAERYPNAIMPGYTHLQRAQPILFAHWCLAYFEMLERDRRRFANARQSCNVSPLGSAALSGTSYPLDREATAAELEFETVTRNSLDATADRDFLLDFTHACSLAMLHLSRLAEDTILYASTEFGFFALGDSISSGSSLMPQKKNPDAMELVRGKTARVYANHSALLTLMKGLPLAYNKDLQEDKTVVFDAFDTTLICLQVTALVLQNITLNVEAMQSAAQTGYLNATELADYLVRKNVPFRTAHELTGRIVRQALSQNKELHELSLDEFKDFSDRIEPDVYERLSLAATVNSKAQIGGTASHRVRTELAEARRRC